MFLFLSSLFVCFQLPWPLLILTSKTPCVSPAGRQAAGHHSHAIPNGSWRMLLLQADGFALKLTSFGLSSPPNKGMAPAVWHPLQWSRDYLLLRRSSGGSKQRLPDVGFITLSGTTLFFMGTLVFKVFIRSLRLQKLPLHAQKLL